MIEELKEDPCKDLQSIASLAPTICRLMNIPPPLSSGAAIISQVINEFNLTQSKIIDKVLIYSPDAIGREFYYKHSALFQSVRDHAPIEATLCSIFPPKTPVCFASMFTGAPPEIHGIKEYRRPVVQCDTLFDVLVRERKNVAIVAVTGSSMDVIFRHRDIDYYSKRYDEQATERALELIEQGLHDVIVVYNQEYDDVLHRTTPESPEAINAVMNHVDSFNRIASAVEEHWKGFKSFIAFTPDHGAHIDKISRKGTHGDNVPEDMQVVHLYGITDG
ncbi:alkaline phosphatase family protein [bacterium]|nr:alkaline phosphatase family protein [bacterium]